MCTLPHVRCAVASYRTLGSLHVRAADPDCWISPTADPDYCRCAYRGPKPQHVRCSALEPLQELAALPVFGSYLPHMHIWFDVM